MSGVEVRAFRGTRRSSVYRACHLGAGTLERVAEVAARQRLEGVPAVEAELDKEDAQRLADAVAALQLTGELLDIEDELSALAAVARWCARAPRGAWLTVRRSANAER